MTKPIVNVNVGGPTKPSCTYKTKVLKGNLPFAAQVSDEATKYVIKFDFDLGGGSVTIPEGCLLEFDGGSISNGTVVGQETYIVYIGSTDVTSNVTMEGTWRNDIQALDVRVSDIEGAEQIIYEGGDAQIAHAEDFNNPTSTQRAKITTVGSILDTMDVNPTQGSTKPVRSNGVYNAINTATDNVAFSTNEKLKNVGIDSAPLSGSNNLPKSGGVYTAINNVSFSTGEKVNATGIDAAPVENSNKLVKSGGVHSAIASVTTFSTGETVASVGIDDVPTAGSERLVKSGGVFNDVIQSGVFDLSAYNSGATYADLNVALTALNSLSSAYKKGGMSIKFVQSSDNKYVQYRLMSDTFNTTPANWQGVDDEPISRSNNLVKSGGVFEEEFQQKLNTTLYEEEWDVVAGGTSNGHAFSLNIPSGTYEISVLNVDAHNTGTCGIYTTPSGTSLVPYTVVPLDSNLTIKLTQSITKLSIGDINSSITESGKMKLVIRKATGNRYIINELQTMQEDYSKYLYGEFINGNLSSGNFTHINAKSRVVSLNILQFSRDIIVNADTSYSFFIAKYDTNGDFIENSEAVSTLMIVAGTRFRIVLYKDSNATTVGALIKHYIITTKIDDVYKSLNEAIDDVVADEEGKDLYINGIRRTIQVTAGTGIPSSVLQDIVLGAGVYSLLLRNVTTTNSGTGIIQGLSSTYHASGYEVFSIGTWATFTLGTPTSIRITDTTSSITTSGTMEFIIVKRMDSLITRTDNLAEIIANKPGGILWGDFYNGSLNGSGGLSTSSAMKRAVNFNFIKFDRYVKLIAKDGYRIYIWLYDDSGTATTSVTWATSQNIPANTNCRILIEKTSHSANYACDVNELVSAISIEDPANDPTIKELIITPAQGGLSPTGVPNTNARRIRGANITYADKDYIVFVDPSYWMAIAFYSANDVNTFTGGANDYNKCYAWRIPKGSYFNIFIGREYVNITTSEWWHLHIIPADSIELFNYDNYDIVKRNKEAINNILAAQKHAALTTSRDGNSSKKFTIAHITDIHDDILRMKNFNAFTNYLDTYVTACILTGDFVVLPKQEEYQYIMPTVDTNSKIIKVVGNHEKAQNDLRSGSETYGQWFYNTRAEMYANLNMNTPTGKLYYYKDFMSKFRVIVINQYDYDEDENYRIRFTQDQIDWLITTLKDATTNNLHVIIAEHDPETFPTSNNKGFYQRFMPWGNTPWQEGSTAETIIEDIVNAFKNGSSLTKSYSNNITVDTTFDTAGTFVAYMCGHVHEDAIGYSGKYTDQLYLCCTNGGFGLASIGDSTYAAVGEGSQDIARICASKSEDSFNVYVFDDVNKLVKVIRVGSDVVDDMSDRKKACFSY